MEGRSMTTKLKIDLSQGVLEVEGSETFVKAIYADFKAHFVGQNGAAEVSALVERPRRRRTKTAKTVTETVPVAVEVVVPPLTPEVVAEPPVQSSTLEPTPEPMPPPITPTYHYIEDLKLGAGEGHPSLVKFMDAKLPVTNEERNLVFLYYLQHILKVKPITLDHIYTCYRAAKIRAPLNLENSLRTTAEQRGWIKTNQNGNITVTSEGKQYTEKQLPKKVRRGSAVSGQPSAACLATQGSVEWVGGHV
jgi:hypothetical protein